MANLFMGDALISKSRPKNLNLFSIRLPLAGKLSILHRVSGAGLFLMLPVLLCVLEQSLVDVAGFEQVKHYMGFWFSKLIFSGLIWAYMHHFCAGIRFLLLDFHIAISKEASVKTAAASFIVSLLLSGLIIWRVVL